MQIRQKIFKQSVNALVVKLVYPHTLDYIFRNSKKKMTRDSGGVVAYALIEYFEQNKMGPVD